jgi:hypothetical protein
VILEIRFPQHLRSRLVLDCAAVLDLKRAQRTNVSWFKFLGSMTASTVSLGPGATMAGFWYWREKMLEKKVVVKN